MSRPLAKTIICAAAVLFVAAAVGGVRIYFKRQAASRQAPILQPAQRPHLTIEELAARLDLNQKQATRLRPILSEESSRRKAILAKYSPAGRRPPAGPLGEAMRKELELFQKYYEDMYSHILTREQFKQFMQLRHELSE